VNEEGTRTGVHTACVEDQLRLAASRLRDAIIQSPRDDIDAFRDFPRGSCGDASILLGEYLHQTGHGDREYVTGERISDFYPHAWVERDGLIIDITADQFDGIDQPVIITDDPSWHRQFSNREPRHPALIDIYDPATRERLRDIYVRVTTSVTST
jgi:hypothetical protein